MRDRRQSPGYPPPLSRDEQIDLCRKAQAGDNAARNRLIETSMRLVVLRAHRLTRISPEIDVADLINEGVFGLVRAIEKFDPDRGIAFVTYATLWVDNHIRRAAFLNRGVSPSQQGRGTGVVRDYLACLHEDGHDAAIAKVADKHGIGVSTAARLVAALRRGPLDSLDAPIADGEGPARIDMLADTAANAEDVLATTERARIVADALERMRHTLNARELAILDRRILAHRDDRETLGEVGSPFGLCRERMRQIEADLKDRLRTVVGRVSDDAREKTGGAA